ncbi:UNVERIFIED_CONTAM: hypothetical protein HDU68_007546, partial [Siphonaria sp. JEL0065]
MKLTSILSSLLLAATAIAGPVRRGAPQDAPGLIDGAYILNFPVGVDSLSAVDAHFKKLNVAYEVRVSVSTSLANFVSVQIKDSVDVDLHLSTLNSATTYSAVRVRQSAEPVAVSSGELNPPQPELIHQITGVNQARKELGLTGKGINVAVIDTGVYYLHPALGGGFGPGFKVAKGYDFVGDAYGTNGIYKPVPDADPFDNCSGSSHGTHVAGIVAGNAQNITVDGFVPAFPFTGVAPDANIFAYRVFGCNGSAGDDVIVAAIYKAAEDG